MTTFFTADLHLGHSNIVKYCDRPFKDADDMNTALIRNWNQRAKPGDIVFHLGDFCCRGNERGVPGVRTKAESWERELNGKIIHIKGNHDANNGVKAALDMAVLEFSGKKWLLVHRPPYCRDDIPRSCDVVLCGHVHEKWSHRFVDGIVVINVGVDQHRFIPLTKAEVETLRYRAMEQLKRGEEE